MVQGSRWPRRGGHDMFPLTSLQVAHDRAAELQHAAAKSRSARAVALAARQQDGPIVTAKPVRPAAVPGQSAPAQSVPAQPATQPAVALAGLSAEGQDW